MSTSPPPTAGQCLAYVAAEFGQLMTSGIVPPDGRTLDQAFADFVDHQVDAAADQPAAVIEAAAILHELVRRSSRPGAVVASLAIDSVRQRLEEAGSFDVAMSDALGCWLNP